MKSKEFFKAVNVVLIILSSSFYARAYSNDGIDAISIFCELAEKIPESREKIDFSAAVDPVKKMISYEINQNNEKGDSIFKESKVSSFTTENDNLIIPFSNGENLQLKNDLLTKPGLVKGIFKGRNLLCGATIAADIKSANVLFNDSRSLAEFDQFILPRDNERIRSVVEMAKSWISSDKKIRLDFVWQGNSTTVNFRDFHAYFQTNLSVEDFPSYLGLYNPNDSINQRVTAHVLIENPKDVSELSQIFKNKSHNGKAELDMIDSSSTEVRLTVDCSKLNSCLILIQN